MRPIQSVLVPLVFLTVSVSAADAQNVCVRGADGAIVCGPVADRNDRASPNPFDQPGVAQPINQPPPIGERKPLPRRASHEAERRAPPPPRHAYREPPPRQFERRPPPKQAYREPPPREFDRRPPMPPREADRRSPPRYSEAERHQSERDRYRDVMRGDRDLPPPGYEARLRELEREVRALRERERYSVSQRPRTRSDRYSADD